jgi:two-component system chemotaxis response regulator CheB
MIRVLIIDDSATMRALIRNTLTADPQICVVGEAADPLEARTAIKALNPDVLTLDVEMPNMSGLDFLERIMRLRPMPVVMVSTLTSKGAEASLNALELGAVDCVAKPVTAGPLAFAELADKVKAAASARVRPRTATLAAPPASDYTSDGRMIAIGSSTGGVEALITILSGFPANCPPTVITQHMPGTFTKSFAERLDRITPPHVSEAVDGAILSPGHVYLAPGGPAHLEVVGSKTLRCRVLETGLVNGHRPSVDVLFNSVAKAAKEAAIGVILTGMGRDGAAGLLAMREAGAATFGQNEATCVVYGMPKAAMEIGAVQRQLPLERIAGEVLSSTTSQLRTGARVGEGARCR